MLGMNMIEIMGKEYLTDKEASQRYGYSQSWFRRARAQDFGPRFVQIKEHGRVIYPLDETDKWFQDRINDRE